MVASKFGFAAGGAFVAVAASVGIVDDRGVKAVTHVFEIALERGEWHFKQREEVVTTDNFPVLKKLIDLIEALKAIHVSNIIR